MLKLGAAGAALAAAARCGAPKPAGTFDLEEWTVAELRGAMERGDLTAHDIAEQYLKRIEALDPGLRSVLETNPDALDVARRLDEERSAGSVRGPLHGIPVLIKDNLDTADRMTTTAGSLALEGTRARQDAPVVKRLREAGIVLLGKTNLSEWANFRSERSSSGWSGRGGQTRNPYAPDRSPCGSSSGSGAAVAASFCAIAIGTETDGSIVCPSNANGIVGIKPTLGRVPGEGIVPIAKSQDTAGPMARSVADAAALLTAMNRHDDTDFTKHLKKDGLSGAKIGVWRSRFDFHERVERILEDSLKAMEEAGATFVDVDLSSIDEIGGSEYTVLLYEFKAGIAAYLATRGEDTKPRTLADLIEFNEAHRDREMPYFEQEIFLKAEEKGPLTDQEYTDALEKCRRLSRDEGLDRVLTEHGLDAVVGPTGGPAWKIDLINGDHFTGGSTSRAAAVSGYSNITVPAGYVSELPVGISFIGGKFAEPRLIELAYAFEQATRVRRAPRLDAT